MGLGPAADVTLAEARDKARDARRLIQAGTDPIESRRQAKAASGLSGTTFRAVADRYLAAHHDTWRSEKHRWQWGQTLSLAHAVFGDRPVSTIDTGDVMAVLEPIWRHKPETASRLRGRIEAVLDYGKARGWREGENPARWRGHLANLLPARSKIVRVKHHAALPWAEIAAFITDLQEQEGVGALALRFTILTAARTGETIGATWAEMDLGRATWTVPAVRMKAGREHRVPLSDAALSILRPLHEARTHDEAFVFPGGRSGKALSNMAMIAVLRRMRRGDLTTHGFRSAFRDWCSETTGFPREVAEAALAHILADKVEAAYRRGDLFEKRRQMMDQWAAFCAQSPVRQMSNIITIRSG